ncbi:MAG: hypothetical protein M1409_02475 [Actinobacteria bacterium]|nr:hypothetical protein [Actinomycetota bacterium]
MVSDNSIILTKNIVFTFPKPITKEDFIQKIKDLCSNVLSFLKSKGCNHLGHIKFISTTDGEDYLQVSVIDMEQAPKVDGILIKSFEKIKTTLNIIVFGIEKKVIDEKINEEIGNLEKYFNVL